MGERSFSDKERSRSSLAARFRSRSQSTSRPKRTPSLTARFRGRSGSRSATTRLSQHTQNDDNPPPPDSSERPISAQVADIMERHQLAMKMEMIEMMENHEKEVKFWKNKAMKMKKKMSQEGPTGREQADSRTASSSGDDAKESEQKLMEKNAILEKEVENRDIVIDSLREMMEMQDKANEEKVQLLENQLERLVEMTTSTNPHEIDRKPSQDTSINSKTDGERNDPAYEVSVLEQLLARVLAEKDKFKFENQNLRSVLKETKSPALISPEKWHGEGQGDGIQQSDCATNEPNNVAVGIQPKPKDGVCEHYSFLYQMSCRNCQESHAGVKYVGKCDGNGTDTQKVLKRILSQHFSQVWTLVQEENARLSSSGHGDELSESSHASSDVSDFPSSSLAKHVAKHCGKFWSEGDVATWCKDNIKVEIQQGNQDSKLRSFLNDERKRKKKSRQHHKGGKKLSQMITESTF